jgi:hypothetical protein
MNSARAWAANARPPARVRVEQSPEVRPMTGIRLLQQPFAGQVLRCVARCVALATLRTAPAPCAASTCRRGRCV